jgi:hypothetical protein
MLMTYACRGWTSSDGHRGRRQSDREEYHRGDTTTMRFGMTLMAAHVCSAAASHAGADLIISWTVRRHQAGRSGREPGPTRG